MAKAGMQVVIALWVFTLGTCIGSFLNVVIYRLPARMSLSRPRSRCPRCETELSMRDNIPVLGWFLLRGRCRYCELPIASRYPIIEATAGVIFLGLMFGELLRHGANMPHWEHGDPAGGFWLDALLSWEIASLYLHHCVLLVVVLATAMISWDSHLPAPKLTIFGAVTALGMGVAFPHIRSVHFLSAQSLERLAVVFHVESNGQLAESLTGAADWILGIAAGFIAGRVVLIQVRAVEQRTAYGKGVAEILLLMGAFLGWQAICLFLALLLPGLLVLRIMSNMTGRDVERFAGPGTFFLLVGFLLGWKQIDAVATEFCGVLSLGARAAGWFAVCTFFALVAGSLVRQSAAADVAIVESADEE